MYWSGLMRILSQSEQLVRNIVFENMTFNVTKGHNGKAVHIEVRGKNAASYTEVQGYRIENIKFKNILICGDMEAMVRTVIRCGVDSPGCAIDGVKFENVICNDRKITAEDILNEGAVTNVVI